MNESSLRHSNGLHLQLRIAEGKVIMKGNHRTDYLDRETSMAGHGLRMIYRDFRQDREPKAEHHQEPESRELREMRSPSARVEFNGVIQNARMTFSSFIETKFIPEHVEHKTIAGQTHYKAMLKHLIRPEAVHRMFNLRKASARLQSVPDWPYLDEVRLCDLSAEHVRKLVSAAFARSYSWQTVKHIKNVTFAIVAHAQQEGCFHGFNPVSQVKLPPKSQRATPDLSINETRAILEHLPSPEKHVALFTVSTGMNIQEISKLQWRHVNLTQSPRVLEGELIPPYSIAVRMQWNRSGLGSAIPGRNRNIAIPVHLFAVLTQWALEERASDPDGFVLLSEAGQPLSTPDLPSSRLVRVGRKLGIPWLSWRVLCRAHVALLSEFRPQLDSIIANTGLNGLVASGQKDEDPMGVFIHKSDTIRSKFSNAVLAWPVRS